jgi:hypothetical protein
MYVCVDTDLLINGVPETLDSAHVNIEAGSSQLCRGRCGHIWCHHTVVRSTGACECLEWGAGEGLRESVKHGARLVVTIWACTGRASKRVTFLKSRTCVQAYRDERDLL